MDAEYIKERIVALEKEYEQIKELIAKADARGYQVQGALVELRMLLSKNGKKDDSP